VGQPGSPAGMFLWMISPQSFFNIVTKKMAEHYKVNHFDIALDPFEVKIGFGEQSMIKPKSMQSYYSYCAAANLNGYQQYTIWTIATSIVMIVSHYLRPIVVYAQQPYYLYYLLISLYSVIYAVATRIKVFPGQSVNQDYQWMMDLWFGYYRRILHSHKHHIDECVMDHIIKTVSSQVQLWFLLYRVVKVMGMFLNNDTSRTHVKWLFDESLLKQTWYSQADVIDHLQQHSMNSAIDDMDAVILQLILPHDFLIKYLFSQQDMYHTIDYVIDRLYDWSVIDEYCMKSIDSDDCVIDMIRYMSDYRHMKNHFFGWVKDMIVSEIRWDDDEEIEEFMSMIGSGVVGQIPDQIRRESAITERLMNFYLNYVWWLWGARGDTFELLLYHQIRDMVRSMRHQAQPKSYDLDLYRYYLNYYKTNASYYHYVYEGVRSGKASFTLPYIIESDEVYAHMSMVDLLLQSSMVILMQDMLPKNIKLYPQWSALIQQFKQMYGDRISSYIKQDYATLVSYLIPSWEWECSMFENDSMIASMRESLYTIDVHCYHEICTALLQNTSFASKYGPQARILVAASLRETVYGVLCMMTMIEIQNKYSTTKTQAMIQFLLTSYVIRVLGLQDTSTMIACFDIIYQVYHSHHDILKHIVRLDDNGEFLMMGAEFMNRFLKDKDDPVKAHLALLNEDVVWLRWYLKHINYYNKRYFIPQS